MSSFFGYGMAPTVPVAHRPRAMTSGAIGSWRATWPRALEDAARRASTSAQRAAVTTPSTLVAVIAAAGSGKTRVLTRRIAYRIATGTADAGTPWP